MNEEKRADKKLGGGMLVAGREFCELVLEVRAVRPMGRGGHLYQGKLGNILETGEKWQCRPTGTIFPPHLAEQEVRAEFTFSRYRTGYTQDKCGNILHPWTNAFPQIQAHEH